LREQIAYVLNDIYVVYMSIGQTQRARAALDEAQQLWRELGVLNILADNLAGAASLHVLAGEYDRALALSDEALRVSQSIDNLWNQSYSLYMIDLVYMERGEMGRAIQVAEECIRLAEQAGFLPALIQTRTELAFIYGILGAFQRAFEMAELTLAAAKGQSFLGMAGPTLPLAVVAYLHALDGNLAEAEVLLAEAQSRLDASGAVTGAAFFIGLADSQLALAKKDYAHIVAGADAAIPCFVKQAYACSSPMCCI